MALTVDNNHLCVFTTDAEFRTWATSMHTAIVAAGWVNTADTGQIDLTTVLKPAAGSTFQGKKVYRLNDTNAAATPVYAVVDFGAGGAASRPAIRIQLGPSTNGAGTLTGVWASTQTITGVVNTGTTGQVKQTNSDSQDGVNLVSVGFDNATNVFQYGFLVERWPTSAGVATSEGLTLTIWGNIGASGSFAVAEQQIYPAGVTVRAQRTTLSVLLPPYSSVEGSDSGVFPQIPNNGRNRYPALGLVSFIFADVAPGSTFAVSRYGTSRTYKAITGLAAAGAGFGNSSGGFAILAD